MDLDSLLEVAENYATDETETIEAIEESFKDFDDGDKHRAALIKYLYESDGFISYDVTCGGGFYTVDGCEYLVFDDEGADTACADYIKESLWAFKPSFLADQTGLSIDVFTALQELYEEANPALRNLIDTTCGMNAFVEEAIEAEYGRGHFLSSWDGEEREVCIGGEYFFLYRV